MATNTGHFMLANHSQKASAGMVKCRSGRRQVLFGIRNDKGPRLSTQPFDFLAPRLRLEPGAW